jgi:CRP-like cAMP-binding protein
MNSVGAAFHKNGLLQQFPHQDQQVLQGHGRLVQVKRSEYLLMEGEIIRSVYFPVSAVCAVSVADLDGGLTETAIFGREGCSDLVLAPGRDVAPLRTTVQVTGDVIRFPAATYCDVLQRSPAALAIVLRFQQALITQLAYTSACRVKLPVAGRVARWLLMYQDRTGDLIPIVQEDFASALGIQRTYLSQALRKLEDLGLIRTARGRIGILNRAGLIEVSRWSYGPAEAEYARTLGNQDTTKS